MHHMTKISALVLGTFGLAACDGASDPFAFDKTYTTFAEIQGDFQTDVLANVEINGRLQPATDISETADFASVDGGSAIYNGAIIADEEVSGDRVIGQLQIEADFGTDRLDGRAGNFIREGDDIISGTLFGSSAFTRDATSDPDDNGNHFTMDLFGTLDDDGTSLVTTIALEGNFLNNGGDVTDVAGDADITVGSGLLFDQGAFSASR
jgi:hypothetical protein